MNIDWFTVGAQVVNFLILLVLLKRFLYQPLLTAMDKRQQTIAARWEEAEHTKNEAQSLLEDNERQRKELRDTKEASLLKIREEAETQKQHLFQEVRTEVQQRKEQWHRSLEQEREDFLQDLRRRVGQETLAIARQALNDLASEELEQSIFRSFLQKITTLDPEEQKKLSEAVKAANAQVTLQSRFPLTASQQQEITQQLQEITKQTVTLHAQEEPSLVCGLLLKVEPYQLAWHLQQYLESLTQEFLQALSQSSSQTRETSQ